MNEIIKKFCQKHNLTIDQFYGKDKIEGYLDLRSLTSIPIGFNPIVSGYLDLSSLTSIPDGFNPTVGGSLFLNSLTSIPKGFNPTVGGSLDLRSLTSIPKGFNPIVGGGLDLNYLTSIPDGFNPTVGGSLFLRSLTSIPDGFNPTVGGYLFLRSLTSIPKGFNPTVGGDLYLDSLTSIPDGFNPTVGWSLDLRSLTSIPKGFNPTVGYNLYLGNGLKGTFKQLPLNSPLTWQDGKYIKVDGIFTEVVSKRGNVYRVKKIGKDQIIYLITDGEKWSHGETLKEAKADLMYKISNHKKEDYKGLSLKDVLSFEEGIMCYRVITGACSFGVKDFVKNHLKGKKKSYCIEEIIKVTDGQYGNKTFREFFKK